MNEKTTGKGGSKTGERKKMVVGAKGLSVNAYTCVRE